MASIAASSTTSRIPGAMLGVHADTFSELIRKVEHGFSYHTLESMEDRSGVPLPQLAAIIGIPERTLARRKVAGRLTSDESERLLRVSTVFEKALDLFEGDRAAALKWLTTTRKALDRQSPLMYSRTELGAREVENLIGRLEHGVFS